MAKFVFTYTGGGDMPASDEERAAVMQAWTAWFDGLGAAVVDMGNPCMPGTTVTAGGTSPGAKSQLTGYSIVTADNLDAATAMAGGCPILQAPNGAVEVYEALAM